MIIARAFLSIFLFLTAFSSFGHAAGPGIMLEPLRVEFPEGKRYAIVTVFNQSHTEPVSYSISTLPLRMDENGGLYEPEEWTKRDFLTQSMIRFSPRTATIEPSGKQAVRIAIRKPPNLPDGEYMTYMRVAPLDVPGGAVASAPSSKGTAVSIDLRVGVRIPLIIYVGDGSAQTTVDDASLGRTLDGKRAIDVKLNRSGPRSSYVGVSVYSKKNDIKKLVAHNPRVVTFFPLESRIVNMPTTDDPFEGGVLQVEINDYNDPQRRVHSSKEFKVK